MVQRSSLLKKIGIGLGIFFGVLVLAAITVPLVVDVDSYRPKIVAAADEYLNGKLELGKLSLSLWGQVKIQVAGVGVVDAEGRKVLGAKDVYFHVPVLSLLSGSPVVTLKMQKPELFIVKNKKGKLNVMQLIKEQSKGTPPLATTPPADGGAGSGGKSLPSIAVRARVGIEVTEAHLAYKDEATDLTSQIKDLNVRIQDLSLSHPVKAEVWANLDTAMGEAFTVKGPARLELNAKSDFFEGKFQHASVDLFGNLDDLEITVSTFFGKNKGMLAHAKGKFDLTPDAFKIENLSLTFHNAQVDVTGAVTALASEAPKIDMAFKSNVISLAPWSSLVPMLKTYDLGGSASISGGASGTTVAPKYHAELAAKEVSAKSPMLKAQPLLDAKVVVNTDRVDSLIMTMKAPGNDLKITGSVVSFSKPRIDMAITSSGMDLDQLINFPEKPKGGMAAPPPAGAKGTSQGKLGASSSSSDYDAMLDSLRKNPMAVGTTALIKMDLASLKAYGVKMTKVQGSMSFKDLVLVIERFGMGLWGGSVGANFSVQLKPKVPTYSLHAEVNQLDLKQAVASQFELFKNTLLGKASFKMAGTGASLNPEPAKGNLNAKGSMKIADATFATVDVGKVVAEAANRALSQLQGKIPGLKPGSVKPPNSVDSKYEVVTSDFSIMNGVFSAPNFFAKAQANMGLDIRGNTTVNIKDYALIADWEVVDTYNLTKLKDVAVDQSGVRVDHIFAEGANPVKFPLHVGGTALAPAVSYTGVPEALVSVALNNVSKAAEGKVKAELNKKAQEELQKAKANPEVKKALEGLGKKLFGK